MISQLAITSAASSRHLLTSTQRRVVIGLASNDSSQDTPLTDLSLRISDAIAAECQVAIGSGAIPTLLRETVTETLRFVCEPEIILARRHGVSITSVTVDGTVLDAAEYFVDTESGMLYRLSSDQPTYWQADKIVIVYLAGVADDAVPGDLQQAAADFLRLAWLDRTRNPSLKSERTEIVGVETLQRDYWVGSVPGQSNAGAVPDIVAGQLQRFRNGSVA